MNNVVSIKGGKGREDNEAESEGVSALDIDSYIPFQLVYTHLMMNRVVRAESDPHMSVFEGLSKGDWRILILLHVGRANSPTEITEVLGMDRALITRHISALSAKKLIQTKKDPTDMRRKTLQLTAKGKKAASAVADVMSKFGSYLDSSITAAEKRSLIRILHKLNATCANYPA